MNDLLLKKFEATSFAGIDQSAPIVIDFTKARKGNGVTMLRGDQGTRKSSTLMALMTLMGATFNFEMKNFVNNKDETIDISLEFEYEGEKYEVTQSGQRVTLKKYFKQADKWVPESSPKDTLRKIFGNLGVSPMFLKDLDGKKQIKWFKETFGVSEETSKKELKMIAAHDKAFVERRDAGRSVKDLKGWLNENDLYKSYEKSQKKFAQPISAEKEKEKLDALREKKSEFDKNKHGLDSLKESRENNLQRIKSLESQLEIERRSLATYEKRIADGEKYVSQNLNIDKEFEKANADFLNISKTISEQTQWKEVLRKEKELDDFEQLIIRYTGQIDKLRADLLELTSTYLPKIKGLEIRTKASSIDNGDEDEGIFFEGKSLAQLSESEIWDLFLLIWEKKDVWFVFCENVSSLGSQAVATLNRLVKEKKAQIFASEVDRKKDTMEITFENKIS